MPKLHQRRREVSDRATVSRMTDTEPVVESARALIATPTPPATGHREVEAVRGEFEHFALRADNVWLRAKVNGGGMDSVGTHFAPNGVSLHAHIGTDGCK